MPRSTASRLSCSAEACRTRSNEPYRAWRCWGWRRPRRPSPLLATQGKSGLGDTTFFSLLAPAHPKTKLLWGIGPTLIFPTASPEILGQEKWQAGPAAVALYMSKQWVIGVLPQHWWSYAGDGGAPSVNFTNVQYFVQRLLPHQWQIGMAQYAVVHPDDIGQRWNLRFVVTPVLPALVKHPLFGGP